MDGVELTTRFRQWESKMALNASHDPYGDKSNNEEYMGRLIIMGMSANNDEEFARETLTMGFDTFIAKVLTSPTLNSSHNNDSRYLITLF